MKKIIKKVLKYTLICFGIIVAVYSHYLGINYIYQEGHYFLANHVECVAEQELVIDDNVSSYAMVTTNHNTNYIYIYKDMTCQEFDAMQDTHLPDTWYGKVCAFIGIIFIIAEIVIIAFVIIFGCIAQLYEYIHDKVTAWIENGGPRKKDD